VTAGLGAWGLQLRVDLSQPAMYVDGPALPSGVRDGFDLVDDAIKLGEFADAAEDRKAARRSACWAGFEAVMSPASFEAGGALAARRTTVSLVLALSALAILALAAPANAAFPGANGKIAFGTDRDGTGFEI
jgi:hypothetical protein